MTVLADRFDELRAAGVSYGLAVRILAGQMGVDPPTVRRVLTRADRPAHLEREHADVSRHDGSAPTGRPAAERSPLLLGGGAAPNP